MRKRIARLTSNILNPLPSSLIVILLLSFEATSGILDALKWSLILIAPSILPVYATTVYLVRIKKIEDLFINIRQQRTGIYLLASVCTGAGYLILRSLGAPPMLVATSVAGLAAIVVFMLINLWWKISIHTAFIAGSVAILIILYGWIAAVTAALVPLTAWARIELGQHSPAQVISGALLATLIAVTVFYLFGLLWAA